MHGLIMPISLRGNEAIFLAYKKLWLKMLYSR